MKPYFSIIIPVYNRERFIERTINSCLNQDFKDFEIIIVDDSSKDYSVQVVEKINDPRIVLIRNDENQERLISRNIGARGSQGEWIVWLDSDDELVPHALTIIRGRIQKLSNHVLGLSFMCRLDTGQLSPEPPHCDEILDYEGYLRWVESHFGKWSEYMLVVNKQTIQCVLFPEDKEFTFEFQYHLDFSYKYKVQTCSDILRLYHFDAEKKKWKPIVEKMLKAAPTFADRIDSIISIHGEYLRRWAPMTYEKMFVGMITQLLLSRQKAKAWRKFIQLLSFKADGFRAWIIMLLGHVSPNFLAYAKLIHQKWI